MKALQLAQKVERKSRISDASAALEYVNGLTAAALVFGIQENSEILWDQFVNFLEAVACKACKADEMPEQFNSLFS